MPKTGIDMHFPVVDGGLEVSNSLTDYIRMAFNNYVGLNRMRLDGTRRKTHAITKFQDIATVTGGNNAELIHIILFPVFHDRMASYP